jgi:hypothetical protein
MNRPVKSLIRDIINKYLIRHNNYVYICLDYINLPHQY